MFTLDGYLKGNTWNADKRVFELKKIGDIPSALLLAGLSVNGKSKDGEKVFGKPMDVKISIKTQEEGKRIAGLINEGKLVKFDCFFVPNNYTNKEGKEVKGNAIMITDSTTVIEKVLEKKEMVDDKPKVNATVSEDDLPW